MTRLGRRKVGSTEAPTLTKKPLATPTDGDGVTDPTARSYQDRVRARKASADVLKREKIEFGHGPPIDEKKGKQIRALVGGSPLPQPGFPVVPNTPEEKPPAPPIPQEPLRKRRPPPMSGVGAGYSFNRDMAAGKLPGPITLNEAMEMHEKEKGEAGLSPETISALKMAQANQGIPSEAEGEVAEAMQQAQSEGDLDAAERTITERNKSERTPDDLPFSMDLEAVGGIRLKLMTKERRRVIESRLKPLDIEKLITGQGLTQNIPIVEGKLEVELRTQSQRENLWCLQYIWDFGGSQAYQNELLSTCRLACSVMAINGKMLPDHRAKVGKQDEDVDKKAFEAKLGIIAGYPVQFVADLSVQFMWFEDRVNDLFGHDSLKNG
jgi:hypothetical protein